MNNQRSYGRIDAILARRATARRRTAPPPKIPRTGVAVLTCMDSRLDVHRILALEEGDVHIIRNAGGAVREDVVLALAMSQRLLGTREILVLHHLDCAAGLVDGGELAAAVERDTGHRPPWWFEACPDPALRVLQAAHTIARDPYLVDTNSFEACSTTSKSTI
jgi:carbonic anhydrase